MSDLPDDPAEPDNEPVPPAADENVTEADEVAISDPDAVDSPLRVDEQP